MFFDYYYLILVVPAILVSLWAQARVTSTFKRMNAVRLGRNFTGYDAAMSILKNSGVYGVRVDLEPSGRSLADHYDPSENVIRLSKDVYYGSSPAAVGVAAHEAGHALQYATDYPFIRIRQNLFPICNIGSTLSVPLIIIGLVLSVAQLSYIGLALFMLVFIFQLVTLPVEYNASNRALSVMSSMGIVNDEEAKQVKSVLSAAALTYVAALLVSLMQMLRFFLIIAGNSRRRN